MPRLEKGQHAPLNVTQKSAHRVFAGLAWEPHTDVSLIEKLENMIGIKKIYHDLDLGCLLFDSGKKPIGGGALAPGGLIDRTGHIYHSGDNVAGVGEGDDQQVSVELLKLDTAIDYILFTAIIKSGHTFGEIHSPEIRIADGYSNHNFLQTALTHQEGRIKSAFAFASIYRKDGGWNIHNISTYLDLPALQKPNGALSSLLIKA